MIYAYIRVSSDKQTVKNQQFEILKYADSQKLTIDLWIKETISSKKKLSDRALSKVLMKLQENDILIVSELSRLGRNLMEVMSILHDCMEKDAKVFAIKEGYELGNNISSKVLAFAFSLSAEIEHNLISQRTKEALARKKSEGMKLGRPKGSKNQTIKLSGKEEEIQGLRDKGVSLKAIGRIYEVDWRTVKTFLEKNK